LRDYYEELWRRLPPDLAPPEWSIRRRFLLSVLRPGDRVIDVGCGEGAFSALAMEAGAGSVIGIDIAEAALARARRAHPDLAFERVEETGPLPFADNRFELAWASEVIEHVPDTATWLSEIRRVLAPGGRLAITTPDHGRVRLLFGGVERYSDPLGDHLHLYTRRSLRALLRDFGFDQVGVSAAGGAPFARRLLLARGQR
jgi:ubiquinone/menaquinone biosynthesis C-methylase UbiE